MSLDCAVLFLIFNRPDTTKKVFEMIRQARPARLYVSSDGARADREGEAEKVAQAREIATHVDWPCEVKTLFRPSNLGCKHAVSQGIDWFFEQEEMGIILEDDCLPSLSFFRFCEEMLNRYRDDQRVGQVSALNWYVSQYNGPCSYFFSRFGPIWGWASWRRAWSKYSVDLGNYTSEEIRRILDSVVFNDAELESRTALIERVCNGLIDTWDYQWGLAKYANAMLSVTPRENLIENIGLTSGTHGTLSIESSRLVRSSLEFPLIHQNYIYPLKSYDVSFSKRAQKKPALRRVVEKILEPYCYAKKRYFT